MANSFVHEGETFRPISAQCKRIATRPAVSTVWRWHRNGAKGVRLEGVRIGGQTYISDEALDRFLAALNQPKTSPVKTPRSRKQRTASKKKAEAILAARGI